MFDQIGIDTTRRILLGVMFTLSVCGITLTIVRKQKASEATQNFVVVAVFLWVISLC